MNNCLTQRQGPKTDLRVNEKGTNGICGVEFADGPDGCRAAVRRQIGAGADWIKVGLVLQKKHDANV